MEWLLTLVTAAALLTLFACSEVMLRRGWPPESTRRLVHLAGAGTAALFPLYLQLRDVVALTVLFSAVLCWTWRHRHLQSIHGVARPTTGALLLPAGLGITALISWAHPPAFAFGALVLAIADPAAALFGERYRGMEWSVAGGRKTAAGSGAFFLVTLLVVVTFTAVWGDSRPLAVVTTAIVLMMIEGTLGYGLDNLPLPIAAALLGESLLGL